MFNNTANTVLFKEKFSPINGKYKFQVTEFYPENTVTFIKEVPADYVVWKAKPNGFAIEIEETAVSELKEKSEKLFIEIYIYPKFK